MGRIVNLLRDQKGASAVEYGLILAVIVIGLVTAINGIGGELQTSFNSTSSSMANS